MRGKEKERERKVRKLPDLAPVKGKTGNGENLTGHIFLRNSKRERQDDSFPKKNSAKDARYRQPSGRVNVIQIPNNLFNDFLAR